MSDILTVNFSKKDTKRTNDRVLKRERIYSQECRHNSGYTLIDGENKVVCAKCETVLDPIWVFTQLMDKESAWHRRFNQLVNFDKEYRKHSKFKCEHCGRMSKTVKKFPV